MAPVQQTLAALDNAVRQGAQSDFHLTAAVCPRCLSHALCQSRHSLGIYRLARWVGMNVYRCGQCSKRSVWWD